MHIYYIVFHFCNRIIIMVYNYLELKKKKKTQKPIHLTTTTTIIINLIYFDHSSTFDQGLSILSFHGRCCTWLLEMKYSWLCLFRTMNGAFKVGLNS